MTGQPSGSKFKFISIPVPDRYTLAKLLDSELDGTFLFILLLLLLLILITCIVLCTLAETCHDSDDDYETSRQQHTNTMLPPICLDLRSPPRSGLTTSSSRVHHSPIFIDLTSSMEEYEEENKTTIPEKKTDTYFQSKSILSGDGEQYVICDIEGCDVFYSDSLNGSICKVCDLHACEVCVCLNGTYTLSDNWYCNDCIEECRSSFQ